ncbi:glycoside hydrolase [Flavobacterium sp. Sd200]|uniref:C40 family peptidase n=1 Tax=Flavobacterium sp. Sd200 TaxID=2692211 RepID=UPI001369C436|nr:NlpC/P60 family protein [Flavobacterium sp. Sd200]MXN90568.1 glycoside hydrolase [Flavobacterium sp. Sd200]
MKLLNFTVIGFIALSFFLIEHSVKNVMRNTLISEPKVQNSKREAVVNFARKYMGVRYCYASNNPKKGFDCSGFVNFVYNHFDIGLPRSSSGFKDIGKALNPKDFNVREVLIFYGYRDKNSIGHVGIICEANGMQSKFIHASSGKEMAVIVSELGSAAYTRRFYKCIDPFTL